MFNSKLSISMRQYVLAVLLAIVIAPGQAASERCGDLQRRIETLLMPPLEASISIALIDLQSHCYAAVNGDRPIAMMSVYKLPIVLTALAATDDGLDLGRSVRVTTADIVSGHSPMNCAAGEAETEHCASWPAKQCFTATTPRLTFCSHS
jgi:beta-lactamase class A